MATPARHRIAFYNDSPAFGGHEVMTVRGVRALAQDGNFEIHFLYAERNQRLAEALQLIRDRLGPDGADRMVPVPTSNTTGPFDALRNHFCPFRCRALIRQLQSIDPEMLIVSQDEIESGSLALFAARRARIRPISYIPLPHRHSEMGAKFATLRDAINTPLFRIPDAFVTISRNMKRKLRDRGVDQPILVVFNGIDAARFSPGDGNAERRRLQLPAGSRIVGMAGRIDFNHKGQNRLVQALKNAPEWHAAFLGEGPDEQHLRRLPKELGIEGDRVHFLPWSDHPEHFFRAIDVLALPSRFEGFPLVMLESVCCGTPVFASDIDGMSEFLPKAWRFPKGDSAALGDLLRNFGSRDHAAETERLREDVMARMTKASFAAGFVDAIAELAERAPGLTAEVY